MKRLWKVRQRENDACTLVIFAYSTANMAEILHITDDRI